MKRADLVGKALAELDVQVNARQLIVTPKVSVPDAVGFVVAKVRKRVNG